MSGRAYTMKELKGIVEYIKERQAYGETKGRKMWVDYANSGNTTRTWQSLKETYLKRILPDIHNPYYRLTLDELRSFRAGSNLTKSDRKLEVHSSDVPEVPNHTDQEEKHKKAIPNYNGDVGNAAGEKPNTKNTDVRRDSVETIILDSNEPCYSSAQDIIRDLETPTENAPVNSVSPAKNIRDLFTYSEPLTPMIQEIVHDFETDESSALDIKLSNHDNNSSVNVQDTKGQNNVSAQNQSSKNKSQKLLKKKNKKTHNKQKSAQNMRIVNTLEEVKSIVTESRSSKENDTGAEKINVINSSNQNDKNQSKHSDNLKQVNSLTVDNSQNSHNTGFTDSSIPNNQEALIVNKYSKESETLELSSESDLSKTVKNAIAKTKSKRTITNNSEEKSSRKIRKKTKNGSVDTHTEDDHKNQIKNNKITLTEEKQVSEAENKNLKMNGEQYVEPVVKIINNATNAYDDINNQNVNNCITEKKTDTKISHDQLNTQRYDENTANNNSQIVNPCLENASLYVGGKVEPNITENRFSPVNNVVLLDSHSESDTSNSIKISPRKRKRENSKALAKVFGFSNGAGNHKRETIISSTISDTNDYTESMSSDSSSWTSDEIEYVASPHKGRRSRKYLNPGSCKIVPLEHDGGLVVAYKGRVYPLIKEERSIKGRELKYMLYAPNKNTDDNAFYWKKKYFEEKKKAQELSSKLTNNKKSSKIVRKSTSADTKESDQNVPQIPDHAIVDRTVQNTEKAIQRIELPTDDKAIKIKIHSDNKEVAIEGQWQNMAPILPNIMQLLDKEPPAKTINVSDDDVKEKISRLEEEIFREIEEIEKSTPENAKKSASSRKSSPDVNVLPSITGPPVNNFIDNTKSKQEPEMENINRRKRGRPKKSEEKSGNDQIHESPVKKRILKQLNRESEDEIIVNEQKLQLVEDIAEMSRKPTPRKQTNIRRNKALQRKQLLIDPDDLTVGYKFPSPEQETLPILNNKKRLPRSLEKEKKTYNFKNPTQNYSSSTLLNESSLVSNESSCGYQDSDCSPGLILKKRKINFPTYKSKSRFEARRKSFRRHKFKCYSSTSESNLSSFSISLRKSNDSSLNTEMYRTDSYRLLWTKKDKPLFKTSLRKIMEITPPVDEFTKELNTLNLSPAPQVVTEINHNVNSILESDGSKGTSRTKTDVGNSSNVSLPPSPELSIVENISVEKNEIVNPGMPQILNQLHANSSPNDYSLHMSIVSKEIHSSEPLMDQNFDFTTNHVEVCLDVNNEDIRKKQNYTLTSTNNTVHMKTVQSPNLATTISDSLLNKIRTVNINDDGDILDQKLNNLFLESAKKIEKSKGKSKKYDAKKTFTAASGLTGDKEMMKSRKRCSTPHKKSIKKTSILSTVEPVIEEHMEYCAPKPRKSCPPSILLNNQQIYTEDAASVKVDRGAKRRKQKEIIKVKILKPIKRYKLSLHSDSGINDSETGVFESELNDSVDLIHNHSDTCINTYDCLQNDSVVINEDLSQDLITLISDTSHADKSGLDDSGENLKMGLHQDCFSSDAQDGSVSSNVDIKIRDIGSSPEAIRKATSTNNKQESLITDSPLSYSSLVTEDLSDGRPVSRLSEWYLLSEDDCTNTNLESVQRVNYGTYLEKLFPVACAFPDLSTITEASREADVLKDAKHKSDTIASCHHQPDKPNNSIPNDESCTCHIN